MYYVLNDVIGRILLLNLDFLKTKVLNKTVTLHLQ